MCWSWYCFSWENVTVPFITNLLRLASHRLHVCLCIGGWRCVILSVAKIASKMVWRRRAEWMRTKKMANKTERKPQSEIKCNTKIKMELRVHLKRPPSIDDVHVVCACLCARKTLDIANRINFRNRKDDDSKYFFSSICVPLLPAFSILIQFWHVLLFPYNRMTI